MENAPPVSKVPRWRWYVFGGFVFVGAIVCVFLHFFPPEAHSFWPKCLFYEFTGILCPGCGSTRALYAFCHGDFLRGMRCNLLLPLYFVVLALAILRPKWIMGRKASYAFFAVVVLFTILRNLPFGFSSYLAP